MLLEHFHLILHLRLLSLKNSTLLRITIFQLFLYSNFKDQMLILQIEEDIEDELVLGPEFW